MRYSNKIKLLITAVVLFTVASVVGTNYWREQRMRRYQAWAYPSEMHSQPLVGTWQGDYVDPDGVKQILRISVDAPIADKRSRARNTRIRARDYSLFNGSALVLVNQQSWPLAVSGEVIDLDSGKVKFSIFANANQRVWAGFKPDAISAQWIGNELHCTFTFGEFTAEGYSTYRSDEPKHHAQASMVMRRVVLGQE